MIPKELNEISIHDINELIEDKIQESISLEYKEELKFEKYEDRKELLADITSFANASGGDLIFGLTAKRDSNGHTTGEAEEAIGIPVDNWDEIKNSLINIIRNSVQPHIPSIHWIKIDGFERGPVVIARIEKSWIAPHMVVSQKSRRFYTRTSAGKFLMDAAEIRSSFLRTAGKEEKVKQFRDIRISEILSRRTPMPIKDGPVFVCHLFPLSVIDKPANLSFSDFPNSHNQNEAKYHKLFHPILSSTVKLEYIRNFDGLLIYSNFTLENEHQSSYLQIYRDGIIELLLTTSTPGKHKSIDIHRIDKPMEDNLPHYLEGLNSLGINSPIVLMISLLNTLHSTYNHHLLPNNQKSVQNPIDRDILILPEIIINNPNIDSKELLNPIFDILWNAVGFDEAIKY